MKRQGLFLSMLYLFAWISTLSVEAALLDHWHVRNPNYHGVAYGDGLYVTVGDKGSICTSPDGISWSLQESETTKVLNGIAFGNNLYVAVGAAGTILSSPDGKKWESQTAGTSETLNAIAFGNGVFVAVGNNGTINVSSNGASWSQPSSGTNERLTSVAYGTPGFVAVGQSGTLLKGNASGTGWQPKNSGTAAYLKGVTFGNNRYLAVYADGITTSADGLIWTPLAQTFGDVFGVTYGGGAFLVFTGGCQEGDIRYSTNNGNTWNPGLKRLFYFLGGTWGNGRFVVVGNSGNILTSANGHFWAEQATGVISSLNGVTNKGGTFAAVGVKEYVDAIYFTRDYASILTSSDGIFWKFRSSGTVNTLNAINQGANKFVTAGINMALLYSGTGAGWVPGFSEWDDRHLYGITYGTEAGLFVAVGVWNYLLNPIIIKTPLVFLSPDGMDWSATGVGHFGHALKGVTYGGGTFVAVGEYGVVYTSANGVNWTQQNSGTSVDLLGVAHGQGTFVAVGAPDPGNGNQAVIRTSTDGITWGPATSGTVYALRGVTFGMGNFVAVGDHGTILVSGDGQNWTPHTSGTTFNLRAVTSGNNGFVAVGENGTILHSDPVLLYFPLIIMN